jgi:hypothetical protein
MALLPGDQIGEHEGHMPVGTCSSMAETQLIGKILAVNFFV